MSEEYKRILEAQLWNIANTLRGKMNADEFRDYILGFIFYKYLSEKMNIFADEILKQDGIKFKDITPKTENGKEFIEAIKEEALEKLGYFLRPEELFTEVAKRGKGDNEDDVDKFDENKTNFILEDLQKILINIQLSTMGTESEEDYENLFEDMDLNSSKLGKTPDARNTIIAKVLTHLDKIDFKLNDLNEVDVLGDAYEYLIKQFASGAGKKAGEFYTPQEVSTVLAKLVTTGKTKLKSVYDPTCGSGSLLLRVAKEVEDVSNFYGQEMNRTTYNLARMNMILHGVHYRQFDIKQDDTLEHPQHIDLQFEAIVANPPFSAQWSANPLFTSDDRFSQYGKLAPSSKADFAFVQHMIYHLADNGIMAIVLPHGALFRGGSEQQIRKYLIENKNFLDAVIGLPANIFYGTGIPTCILVFKKCREYPEDVLFIDASQYYENIKTQNVLRTKDIEKIVDTYRNRIEEKKFSRKATLKEISDNDYNLNIPRYVDTSEIEYSIDLNRTCSFLKKINELSIDLDIKLIELCKELKIPAPLGNNIFLLKQYKKGVLQKIFSQEIRFKDINGKDFQKWEMKTMKDVFVRKTEKNIDNFFTNVLTNSATRGIIKQEDYFEKEIANQNNLLGYYIVDIDDFVYNPRISQSAPVGPLKRNQSSKGIMSPLYTVLRCREGNFDFFEFYFESTFWHKYMKGIANYGVRHDRMNITNEGLEKLPLPFPSLEEQSKIAQFLTCVENKIKVTTIDIEENKINNLNALEKYFVKE